LGSSSWARPLCTAPISRKQRLLPHKSGHLDTATGPPCAMVALSAASRPVGTTLRTVGGHLAVECSPRASCLSARSNASSSAATSARDGGSLGGAAARRREGAADRAGAKARIAAMQTLDCYLLGDAKKADDMCRDPGSGSDAETDSTGAPLDPMDSEHSDLESLMSTSRRSSGAGLFGTDTEERPRYLVPKLETWFRNIIDAQGSGQVKLREFVANLRGQETLQSVLCEVAGVSFTAEERHRHARLSAPAPLGLCAQARAEALLEEKQRGRQIFWEACACAHAAGVSCGSDPLGRQFLDMPGFVAFLRTKGFVLE